MPFASGNIALSICMRCGFEYPYKEVKKEAGTKLLVCPECNDGRWNAVDHPQNHPPKKLTDSVGLLNPSPQKNLIADTVFEFAEENKDDIVDYVDLFVLAP